MSERTAREERLELLEDALDDLEDAARAGAPILVEGEKDVAALAALGIDGVVLRVHTGENLFVVAEVLAREHRSAILLTDWDDRGGKLAHRLREACRANGVALDESHRLALARATRGELKTVESLATYLAHLRERVREEPKSDPARHRRLAREARDRKDQQSRR